MAEANSKGKSPKKSRGYSWKEEDVKELIQIMQEETVMFSLDNAKTPKEKRAAYKTVQVQMQKKGINISLDAIINKWKKLRQQYKQHMLVKLENMRQKEMLAHETRLKELENERRREERQHELMLVNLLSQNRNPFQRMNFYEGSNPVHIGSESSFYEM